MESKAKLYDIYRDLITGTMMLVFDMDYSEEMASEMESLLNKDIRLTIKIWREKRSLDSNAYWHLLITKIAEKLNSSVTEVKNQLLADYGQPEIANDSLMTIIMRDDIEWQKLDTIHLKPTTAVRTMDDGKLYRVYYVMRGSHTFDSAEMSRLISATVDEAKELGIDVATPDDIARMNALWGEKHEKQA